MNYMPREYAEMHYIYKFCAGNARRAAREYRNRYQGREHFPDHRVLIRVHNAYLRGEIPGAIRRDGRHRNDDHDEEVVAMALEEPSTSIRRISRDFGVSKSTVQRILWRHKLHAYHVQRVQALLPDYAPRVAFYREMLRRSREDPQFFNKILWTDESTFNRVGIFNIHNLHSWALQNPKLIRNHRFQHQFGVNPWAGILYSAEGSSDRLTCRQGSTVSNTCSSCSRI